MFKWTILLCALLLVKLASASPVVDKLEVEHAKLFEHLEHDMKDFFKYATKEFRHLIAKMLEDTTGFDVNSNEIKSFKEYIDETKDYETASKEELLEYFHVATELIPIDFTHDWLVKHNTNSWAYKRFHHVYEYFTATLEHLYMKFYKTVKLFDHEIHHYIKKLTKEECEIEAHMIYWYDVWSHEREFAKRFHMMTEFFKIAKEPMDAHDIYKHKINYAVTNYTHGLYVILEHVHEKLGNSFVKYHDFEKRLKDIEQYFKKGDYSKVHFLVEYYNDFDKFLVSQGHDFWQYKKETFQRTIQFFDDVYFYTELYIEYGDVETKLTTWFEDLKKTESFEESFNKYFKVFEML